MGSIDIEELIEILETTPPRCLSGFSPVCIGLDPPWDDNPYSAWLLKCRCGGDAGRVLGHRLSDYNESYKGDGFISPLGFECTSCNEVTEFLDTDLDGYHAEVGKLEGGEGSSKIRGEGPRAAYACAACAGTAFEVVVGFVFWEPEDLAEVFEKEWENFYSVFLCYCRCKKCDTISEPTEFGKL